ncbi:Hsp20/alpha crystallin family protein [Ruminiclostridium herbifermentans]|uniref:Hsp20/alpha crystallin family protein n=1 Tax=Ruminiclostridium herbifermentans TaxID=2488810 RepID=A0A4U7JHB2_9FIRM|nr:Hsp20/alpha crystallin family protein [Ruminiclostridium herbifermentans]QNU67489.1 Hsp20/alpha crystallin family protein [Ruminiclostridium herbifermentans]
MFGIVPFRNNNIQGRSGLFDIDNMFNDFFNEPFMGIVSASSIKADIKENENEFVIDAEIPGVNKEDIKLDLKNDRLTISVEKTEESKEEKNNYIRRERRYGSTSRSFCVQNVKAEDVSAKYENGILTIILPKSEAKKLSSRIEIQ